MGTCDYSDVSRTLSSVSFFKRCLRVLLGTFVKIMFPVKLSRLIQNVTIEKIGTGLKLAINLLLLCLFVYLFIPTCATVVC